MRESSSKQTDRFQLKKDKELFRAAVSRENPLVKASHLWGLVSNQLEALLDDAVYYQWFYCLIPLIISDNILIVKVPNQIHKRWLDTHYEELVDRVLQIYAPELTIFFISHEDITDKY